MDLKRSDAAILPATSHNNSRLAECTEQGDEDSACSNNRAVILVPM